MKELDFFKQTTINYADFDAFDEGEIYYIFDIANHQSVIAVCLTKEHDKAIFKIKYHFSGDFGADNQDQFMIHEDTPNLADIHIFPVDLSFLVDMYHMKLKILSEVDLVI